MTNSPLKKKIIAAVFVFLASSTLFFAMPAKRSQAIFGFGDLVIDIKALLEETVRHFLVTSLKRTNETFTRRFVNKIQSKLKIQNILGYARDVADRVYVSYEIIKESDDQDKYILRTLAQIDLGKLDVRDAPDMTRIYNQKALTNSNIVALESRLRQVAPGQIMDWGKLTDSMESTPQGQRLKYTSKAIGIVAAAQLATQNNLSNGRGYKDIFSCTRGNNSADDTQRAIGTARCVINDPAGYVVTNLNSQIDKLYESMSVPTNSSTALSAFIGATLGKTLGSAVFNKIDLAAVGGGLADDLLR